MGPAAFATPAASAGSTTSFPHANYPNLLFVLLLMFLFVFWLLLVFLFLFVRLLSLIGVVLAVCAGVPFVLFLSLPCCVSASSCVYYTCSFFVYLAFSLA